MKHWVTLVKLNSVRQLVVAVDPISWMGKVMNLINYVIYLCILDNLYKYPSFCIEIVILIKYVNYRHKNSCGHINMSLAISIILHP